MSNIYIPLVDENDNIIGKQEKIKAHQKGQLHRAFSILIFDDDGKLLLQQRAENKYHCGGLWSNSCCSHPNYGEDMQTAIYRRLQEEMGFDCKMVKKFDFIYRKEFENWLIEHELDYVYVGTYNWKVNPNSNEVQDYKWVDLDELRYDMQDNPKTYTYWFHKIMEHIDSKLNV